MVTADVGRKEDVDRAIKEIADRYGRIDILFNNAGMNIRKQPEELTLAEWQEVINTNLTSAFLMSTAVYASMKTGGGGKIVNIGSMTSIFGSPFASAYAATKGGIVQLTKSLAHGLGQGQHSGQLDPAGLVRYRVNREGPGTDPGPSRARSVSNSAGPLGQAGRHGGHGRVAGELGQRLCHRDCHPRGRGLLVVALIDRIRVFPGRERSCPRPRSRLAGQMGALTTAA